MVDYPDIGQAESRQAPPPAANQKAETMVELGKESKLLAKHTAIYAIGGLVWSAAKDHVGV